MIDIKHLRVFLAVAEHLHLSRAAETLGVEQSTLSRQLNALEDDLGVTLFERHRSGIRLTPAGTAFLIGARLTLFEFERTVSFAARSGRVETGRITFGFLVSLSAGHQRELIAGFSSRAPGVEMDFVEAGHEELMARLADRQLDLAFVPRFMPVSGLECERLWCERFFVVVPEQHPLAARDGVAWADLAGERLLLRAYEGAAEIQAFLVSKLAGDAGRLNIHQLNVSRESLINLVGMGQGIAIATDATQGVEYPGVIFRPIAADDARLPISIVWVKANNNPVLTRFRRFAIERSKAWTTVSARSNEAGS